MPEELKPCPFCGKKPELQYRNSCWVVYCCNVITHGDDEKLCAIKSWNTRPSPPATLVPLDAEEIRKWWRFDNNQQPQSTWHDREEFIKRFGLPISKSGKEASKKWN